MLYPPGGLTLPIDAGPNNTAVAEGGDRHAGTLQDVHRQTAIGQTHLHRQVQEEVHQVSTLVNGIPIQYRQGSCRRCQEHAYFVHFNIKYGDQGWSMEISSVIHEQNVCLHHVHMNVCFFHERLKEWDSNL